eukprot:1110222-Amphidinium_carterae.1
MGFITVPLAVLLTRLEVQHRMYVDDIAVWATGEGAACRTKMQAVRDAIQWSVAVGLAMNSMNHKTVVWGRGPGRPGAESKFMHELFPEHTLSSIVKDLVFDLVCSSRTRLVQPSQEKRLSKGIRMIARLARASLPRPMLRLALLTVVYT